MPHAQDHLLCVIERTQLCLLINLFIGCYWGKYNHFERVLIPRLSAKGRDKAGMKTNRGFLGWSFEPLPEWAITVPQGSPLNVTLGFQFWFSEELGYSVLTGRGIALSRYHPLSTVSLLAGLASLGRGHGMRGSRMKDERTCTQFWRAGFFVCFLSVCFCTIKFVFVFILFIFLAALRGMWNLTSLTKD